MYTKGQKLNKHYRQVGIGTDPEQRSKPPALIWMYTTQIFILYTFKYYTNRYQILRDKYFKL